jgi:hypothetical protein
MIFLSINNFPIGVLIFLFLVVAAIGLAMIVGLVRAAQAIFKEVSKWRHK